MVKLAEPGQIINCTGEPERIMLMGTSLKEALKQMKERGIEALVEGYAGEDAVVVRQEPGADDGDFEKE